MGYGFMPTKRSKYAPCAKCEHTDCAQGREDIVHPCRFCQKPIGWGSRYYFESEYPYPSGRPAPVHADCLEDEIEREYALRRG